MSCGGIRMLALELPATFFPCATVSNPLNPTSLLLQLREGLSKLANPRLPAVPGGDVAGVVLEADAGSAFKPGAWHSGAATSQDACSLA